MNDYQKKKKLKKIMQCPTINFFPLSYDNSFSLKIRDYYAYIVFLKRKKHILKI